MPSIYDIEQSKQVFEQVLQTKLTVLVGELCSLSNNIRNQLRTAVTPKQTLPPNVTAFQEPRDIFDNALPSFALNDTCCPDHSLNDIAQAKVTSVDPVEAYIELLPPGEELVTLTVTKEAQSIQSIMLLVDNCEEIECIVDSGSQIISMSAEVANYLGISYDPSIVLNMQSANGTMDKSLGLACNVPCTLGNITFYLQIHVLYSPAYDILLGHPFDVLTKSVVNTLNNSETTIMVTDPNSGLCCTIPTFPCS